MLGGRSSTVTFRQQEPHLPVGVRSEGGGGEVGDDGGGEEGGAQLRAGGVPVQREGDAAAGVGANLCG